MRYTFTNYPRQCLAPALALKQQRFYSKSFQGLKPQFWGSSCKSYIPDPSKDGCLRFSPHEDFLLWPKPQDLECNFPPHESFLLNLRLSHEDSCLKKLSQQLEVISCLILEIPFAMGLLYGLSFNFAAQLHQSQFAHNWIF